MALALALLAGGRAAAAPVDYEREVAPILRSHCAVCHNDADHEGDFSVETFSRLRRGGEDGDPVLPGRPDGSILLKSVEKTAKPFMPPKDEPPVPASDIAVLRRWISEGAPGPKRDESLLAHISVPNIPTTAASVRPVTALAFDPAGDRAALAVSGRVELRTPALRRTRRVLDGLPGKVNSLRFSRDGRQLAVAGGVAGLNGSAQLWDIGGGKLLREFGGASDLLYAAEFSPDEKLLACAGYDRAIRLWDVAGGRLVRTLAGHNGAVFALAFDPSGKVLASASADQTVKLWRVSDGVRLDTLNQPQGELNAVAFAPDGAYIVAAGADRRIHQWKFVSRETPALNPVMASRFAHEAAVTALALSPDGRHLVSAASDRTLKLWSLPDLVERRAWPVQSDVVASMAWDPKRPRFAVGRMDGSSEVFDIGPDASIARVTKPESGRAAAATPRNAASPAVTNILAETEPNDRPPEANRVVWPTEIHGSIGRPGDADVYRFKARRGEPMTLAIRAATAGSALDSRLEVLSLEGAPVEQVLLQAVRDSWFTFRGKDSESAEDFRLQNWREMELDEYLYCNGEVVRLWMYPRGPDSGFKIYPGEGLRQTLFGTTAYAHAVNEPCYIVVPHPPGSHPAPNGLPIFPVYYENDDDPSRVGGKDSLLHFEAPSDGDYLVRVTDVRGRGGATNYAYTLAIRESRPDFEVKLENSDLEVSPGAARELRFVATRREGFSGAILISMEGLPTGFSAGMPVEIEAGQIRASAILSAASGAAQPDEGAAKAVHLLASATIGRRTVAHDLGTLAKLRLGKPPRLTVEILPGNDPSAAAQAAGGPLEFRIRPGQTITARVRAVRHDFAERIELGMEDCGRNLPHGVYVDNIGLNGLLIVEGQTEREFDITAALKAQPGVRRFHLRATADGGQCSPDAVLRVLPRDLAGR